MNGHPFDTKHTFRINRFTDIERYASIDETYVEPTVEEYRPKVWLPYLNQDVGLTCQRNIYEHGSLILKDVISM